MFVDDTGRRRARLRLIGRGLVALAVLYVVTVIVALSGPLSLPIVHIGALPPLQAPRHGVTLGPNSRQSPLPPVLTPSGANGPGAGTRATTIIGRGPSSNRVSTPPPASGPGPGGSPSTTLPGSTTTTPASNGSTTVPVSSTSLPTPPTSTRPGPPTTQRPHGPPTSRPGKGNGR